MFRECLSPHGKSIVESIRGDIAKKISEDDASLQLNSWAESAGEKGDVALKNLEGGDEAICLAARWMTPNERGLKKLQKLQDHLPESVRVCLGGIISQAEARVQALAEEKAKEESQAKSERSEETDEDHYDDRGNTAYRIFAGSSFIRTERSPSTPLEEEARFYTPVSSPKGIQDCQQPNITSPTPSSSIFNQEYADWFTPITPIKGRPNPLPKTPESKKTMNVLLPSANKMNTARQSAISKLPLDLAPTPPSFNTPFTSTLSSSSTKGSGKTPPSPSTVARRDKRRAEREERRRIALKLGRARPDLVSEGFTERFLTSAQEEQS